MLLPDASYISATMPSLEQGRHRVRAGRRASRCTLGAIGDDGRCEPLALTQLMLLYHLLDAVR